jgi:hypothetical protein
MSRQQVDSLGLVVKLGGFSRQFEFREPEVHKVFLYGVSLFVGYFGTLFNI